MCGWELVIKERLTIPPQSTGLFGELITADWNGKEGANDFAFMRMENRLTISLDSYDLLADWTPEDSFVNAGTANSRQDVVIMNTGENAASRRSMLALARKRPLYMFREPQLFDNAGASSLREFCERTMGKWWSSARTMIGASKNSSSMQRDYYKLTDKDQRRLWVFRDISGHWFLHGIYG